VRAVQKHHIYKYVYKKSMSKTFPKKIEKHFEDSFSSTFLFYRVFGCFSAIGVQKHHKTLLSKKVGKINRNQQKIQSRLFLDLFYHVLGVSRGGGVKNTTKNTTATKSGPCLFLASDPPTHPPRRSPVSFWRPLGYCLTSSLPQSACGKRRAAPVGCCRGADRACAVVY
jgi:hypothetical protein